ncbi:MAG: polyprenyl synthetase family protein [Planctomycetaceae bacterium]
MAAPATQLEHAWQALRRRVDQRLSEYLELSSDCPSELRSSMSYSITAGGKRLRPILVLLAAEACGAELQAAMPAACAIEMLHTYSLIHDDLPAMDDDALRRGLPTNHVQFGEAMAILAGDALLTRAFEILATDVQPPSVAAACCGDLAAAAGACGMVGGQVADLEADGGCGVRSVDHLQSIHRRKTGELLTVAVVMGARIAVADADIIGRMREFGRRVGLAFQIMDDLLDFEGDQDKMGKAVRKDDNRGKLTFPGLLGEAESRQRAHTLIAEACQKIEPLGEAGRPLQMLARFVVERDN